LERFQLCCLLQLTEIEQRLAGMAIKEQGFNEKTPEVVCSSHANAKARAEAEQKATEAQLLSMQQALA
jgi:hypothetical protein